MSSTTALPIPGDRPHPDTTASNSHLPYGDLLRTAGAMAVILVHVAHEGTRIEEWVGQPRWWWCAVLDAMGRWAVPGFLMLGGAIFLNPARQHSAKAFYRKRLTRIGWPMLFWSAFFIGWYVVFQQPQWHLPPLTWSMAAEMLFSGTAASHLHYLGVILGLYLFTPMLRVYIRHAPRRQIYWTTGLALGIAVLSDADAALEGKSVLSNALIINRFIPYLGFYLLGFCMRNLRPGWRLSLVAGAAYAGAIAVTVTGTAYLLPSLDAEAGGLYFYGQLSPTRLIMAAATFILFQALAPRQGLVHRLCTWCAPLTLGIYLVHPILMDTLAWAGLYIMTPNAWLGLILRVLAVYAGSMILVWLIRRLPGSQYIVG